MKTFELIEEHDYEQIVYCYDKESGLKAIIAIHDTTLGPALGGTRMWNYSSEEEAMRDVLRLARGMTYKNAAAGLNLGGGKAVIIGDPKSDKNEALFRAFGRYVESLNGRYITAEDVGTTEEDMDTIYLETDFVTGTSSGGVGDPSPVTALGIYYGMKAAAEEAFGSNSLHGRTIAVQGVGHVAYNLCKYLHEEGANLIVTDINEEAVNRAVNEFNAQFVDPDSIYGVECDIYSPCALGGTINDQTIEQLKAKVVAGSANNQLAESRHGELLFEKGIVYAPDYVINSGGVINVADELQGYDRERVMKKVESIYTILQKVFQISKEKNISTSVAADHLAEERIQAIRSSNRQFLPNNKHILRGR
ncbi:Glu/Leu/Phe/Val dehydrogenase [Pseudogracilibacillus sp. SE30717A]|uniref:Glu/Leu/Phe/Val family dehydrogenase n=1 Tax=Pseudogracilibacillus sp. SE30717A TaxID=3098293 RepID=UPI00300DC8F6